MHHHSAACHAHDADYAESKLAMVLLARALSRGDLGRRVDGIPVNPGAANSDIWRHIWAPFQPVFRVLVAPFFLTTDQACASSVAAAATDDAQAWSVVRKKGATSTRNTG